MIYEDIFTTPSQDGVISPDPTYFRRRNGGDLASRTINNGLGLLTSCQQANHEAAAVLYSKHVFSFDDVQYGNLTSMLDISAINHSNVRIEEQGGYVFYMVPRCDRVLMYDWLLAIGDQNRQRIRHIELQIYGDLFMFADGTPNSVMGDHLAHALQLLAKSHYLETIKLSFKIPKHLQDSSYLKSKGYNTEGYASLFLPKWFDLSEKLINALSSIKGIKRLECDELPRLNHFRPAELWWSQAVDDANAALRETRQVMESGYAQYDHQSNPVTLSTTYVNQAGRSLQGWEDSKEGKATEKARRPNNQHDKTGYAAMSLGGEQACSRVEFASL